MIRPETSEDITMINLFVCGDAFPISSSVIRNSKSEMAKQANLKEIRTQILDILVLLYLSIKALI